MTRLYLDLGVLAGFDGIDQPAPTARATNFLRVLAALGRELVVLESYGNPFGVWAWLERFDLDELVAEVRQHPHPGDQAPRITVRDLEAADPVAPYATLVERLRSSEHRGAPAPEGTTHHDDEPGQPDEAPPGKRQAARRPAA